MYSSTISSPPFASLSIALVITSVSSILLVSSFLRKKRSHDDTSTQPSNDDINTSRTTNGGYESLIGNTPLLYLPQISKLIPNNHERKIKVYVKMESLNPGGTGKDRAAQSLILDAEQRGDLPPPLINGRDDMRCRSITSNDSGDGMKRSGQSPSSQPPNNVPKNIHNAIQIAIQNTRTNGILIEGTSGSTGISLASISCSHGHGVIVVMPDDQSSQKVEYLQRLGVGVVIVQNCSISNPHHYVNTANMIYEMIEVDRRYDRYYWDNIVKSNGDTNSNEGDTPPRILKAAFMNQFENLANVKSHYTTTGPEIYKQLNGKVDAFVMSSGTGGTLVGVGGYLKEQWSKNQQQKKQQSQQPPRIVLVDPPGSSLYNKIKYGVAYTKQQSEQKLRRHRYDTLAEGIGLDRITANFALGCEEYNGSSSFGNRIDMIFNNCSSTAPATQNKSNETTRQSKIIDDAYSITDQQAIYMAHYLLRHEGLFVGSSTAMNIVGTLILAIQGNMPEGSNIVTVVCDGGYRHTSRFWNRKFVEEEWGLVWPGDGCCDENGNDNILDLLGINGANS